MGFRHFSDLCGYGWGKSTSCLSRRSVFFVAVQSQAPAGIRPGRGSYARMESAPGMCFGLYDLARRHAAKADWTVPVFLFLASCDRIALKWLVYPTLCVNCWREKPPCFQKESWCMMLDAWSMHQGKRPGSFAQPQLSGSGHIPPRRLADRMVADMESTESELCFVGRDGNDEDDE